MSVELFKELDEVVRKHERTGMLSAEMIYKTLLELAYVVAMEEGHRAALGGGDERT